MSEDLTLKARNSLHYCGFRATKKNMAIIQKYWASRAGEYVVTYNLAFLHDFMAAYPRLESEYKFNKKFNKFIDNE